MKRLIILLILFFAATSSQAQQQGQLYITSYDDTGQIVYVCDGNAQNSVPVQYALLNLNKNVPLTIDSIVPHGDTSVFPFQEVIVVPGGLKLGYVGSGGNASYSPSKVGDDTLYETAYYNGQFTATAAIIFHARSSPDLAMYGYTSTTAYTYDGNSFGEINSEEEIDTMHDMMVGAGGQAYFAGDPATLNGGENNLPVILRSCGGATIDSIYESGNFSSFKFDPFPNLPYTMPGDDSLVLNFEFAPKIEDTSKSAHHYLIFHTTDHQYLTWSFEYYVFVPSGVSDPAPANSSINVFPNPASDELQILAGQAGTVRLFDLLGRERMNAKDDGYGVSLDVSKLESGMYILRSGSETARVVISH